MVRFRKTTYLIVSSRNGLFPLGAIIEGYDEGEIWYIRRFNPQDSTSKTIAVAIRLGKRRVSPIIKRLLEIHKYKEEYSKASGVPVEEIEKAIETALKNIAEILKQDSRS